MAVNRQPVSRHRGFTLIELLVAATLSAVVMTAVYASYAGAVQSKVRIERVTEASQEWRFLAERLRRDLRSLQRAEGAFKGAGDRLGFRTLREDGAFADVEYRLEPSSAGGEVRRRSSGSAEGAASRMHGGVERLTFRYLLPAGWTDSANELPRAVECQVEGKGWMRRVTVLIEVEAPGK